MPFEVKIDGNTFRTDDLTLNEAIQIEADANTNWGLINPFRSAEDAKAVIVAFLTRSTGRPVALERVGTMTVKATLECIDIVEDDRPDAFEEGIPLPEADGASTAT